MKAIRLSKQMGLVFTLAWVSLACAKTPLVERLKHKPNASLREFESWNGNGIVYALPRTAFDVVFSVTRTDLEKPLCYGQYGDTDRKKVWERLELNETPIENSARTLFSLGKATLTTAVIPDPDAVFVVRVPEGKGSASLQLTLGPDGTLGGLQAEATDPALAITSRALEVVGTLAGKVIRFGAATPELTDASDCDEKVDEYEDLQQELIQLRSQPTPFPKDTVLLYQGEIRAEMAKIQALFLGQPKVTLGDIVCRISPNGEGTSPVLSLDIKHGFSSGLNVRCAMPKGFESRTAPAPSSISVSLTIALADSTIHAAYAASTQSENGESGFFYRDPARAYVSLEGPPSVRSVPALMTVAQLGQIRSLPRVQGSNPSLSVELYPDTGAIKSVRASRSGPNWEGAISSAGTGAGAVLDALDAKKKANPSEKAPTTTTPEALGPLDAELALQIAKKSLREQPR
jgi:hypothetical protein